MAANVYECMFLLDTTKVAGDIQAADRQIRTILERNHAEVLVSRPWDERRLAYPINNQKKGLYYLTYFRADGKELINIERDLALNETVLRHLVLRVDPKLVEIMLALARDEHALGLQSVQGRAEGEGGEGGNGRAGGEEGRGPRRGRRGGEDKE